MRGVKEMVTFNESSKVGACVLSVAFFVTSCTLPGSRSNEKATELEITIREDVATLSAGERLCPARPVSHCVIGIKDAFALIQQPEWQRGLGGQFSRVRLRLESGKFHLTSPLALRWGEGATYGVPLDISGKGAGTVLTGGTPIKDWISVAGSGDALKVPPIARQHVYVSSPAALGPFLKSGLPSRGFGVAIRPVLTEVFYRDEPQPIAAWPNEGYARISRESTLTVSDKRTFSVVGRNVSDWKNDSDLQATAFWFWDWASETYSVNKNYTENQLAIAGGGSPYGIKDGQRIRIENALSELDAPGEWYLERKTGKLFFWPPNTLNGNDVEVSIADSLLRISDSRNVSVRDMIIEKARGDAVRIERSNNVVIERVHIRGAGNRGLVVEGGSACGIRASVIENTGEGGATLSGGSRDSLTAAEHFVEGSVIRRFSRLVRTYRFAVALEGVGQLAKRNIISEGPHTAIFFSGNDHRIEGNEIYNVVTETTDAGAIYTGRDVAGRGTVIKGNFLHDIGLDVQGRDVKGVYLDDQASGIVVTGNIFARVKQPVFIGGGRDNVIEGNLFYKSSPAIYLDGRGMTWQRNATVDPEGELQSRLKAVPYQKEPYRSRYPHLSYILTDDFGRPKYNIARDNLMVGGTAYDITPEAEGGINRGGVAEGGEDVFAVPLRRTGRSSREDFRLRKIIAQ